MCGTKRMVNRTYAHTCAQGYTFPHPLCWAYESVGASADTLG